MTMHDNESASTVSKKHLRAKIQIGSCKGPITYNSHQTVFHPDDIKQETRERKKEVNSFKHPSVLDTTPSWQKSTAIGEPICLRRKAENLVHDHKSFEYNYRAEALPSKNREPTLQPNKFTVTLKTSNQSNEVSAMRAQSGPLRELPAHPTLPKPFAMEWDGRCTLPEKVKQQNIANITQKALANSATREKKLVDTSRYQSPMQRSMNLQEEVRRQKKEGTFSVERQVFCAPEEKVDRSKLVNRCAVEPSRKYKTYEHSGTWELNRTEGKYMWSDTGSFDYASKGDIVRTHNPDAYIYAKPTLTKQRK